MTITWDPDSERGVDQAGRNSSHSTCIVKFRAAKESLVTEGKSFNERIRVAKELCAVLREIARGENQEQHSTAISDIVALISRELTAGNAAIASHLIKGLASLGASVCQDLICTALLDRSNDLIRQMPSELTSDRISVSAAFATLRHNSAKVVGPIVLSQRTKVMWPDGHRRSVLPIDSVFSEVAHHLRTNQLVLLQAETGAGKTTRIAQERVMAGGKKVIVTQTRRNAVRSNGRRMANECGEQPGRTIGWKLARERAMTSKETKAILTVDESLLNQIVRDGGKLPEGTIMIDEVHEGKIATSLLLGLIKQGLPKSPNTKVIISSATYDTAKYAEFFENPPLVNVEGRCFPVKVMPYRLKRFEHHSEGAANAAKQVLGEFKQGRLTVPTPDGAGEQLVSKGAVPILLPGKEDIRNVIQRIEQQVKVLGIEQRVEIVACHGESPPEDQDKVFSPVPNGTIRFLVGTEVLRSSVTAADVVGVIDSLEIKRLVTDAKGVAHLQKIPISKDYAKQAEGRAGRTGPGFYIPISFGQEYEQLAPVAAPEILQAPIESVALQIAALNRSIRDFPLLDRPAQEKIEVAITRLQRIGALDSTEQITELGQKLLSFPLDPASALTLFHADTLEVLPEAMLVSAALEQEGIFYRPRKRDAEITVNRELARLVLHRVEKDYDNTWSTTPREEISLDKLPRWMTRTGDGRFSIQCGHWGFPHREGARWVADLLRQSWGGESKSDYVAIVNAYRNFKDEERRLRRGHRRASGRALRQWCEDHFVNHKRLREMENTLQQLRESVQASPLQLRTSIVRHRNYDEVALHKALLVGCSDKIAIQRWRRNYAAAIGEFQLAFQSAVPEGAPLIMISGVRKIPSPGSHSRTKLVSLADTAAAIQPNWLSEMMPHLYHRERLDDLWYDPSTDTVMQTERERYIDQEVARRSVVAEDKSHASETFRSWLLQEMASGTLPETASEQLRAVAAENRRFVEEADQLRTRAGDRELFPEQIPKRVEELLKEHFPDAVSLAEITAPEKLALTPPDQTRVAEVLANNPEQIRIEGVPLRVYYSRSSATVVFSEQHVEDKLWLALPDGELKLPSGRSLALQATIDFESRCFDNGADLKRILGDRLNSALWRSAHRPERQLPALDGLDIAIPDIETLTYGHCVMTGKPLEMYGTIDVNGDRYYTSDPMFRFSWYRAREDAERAQALVADSLKPILEERRERLIEEARAGEITRELDAVERQIVEDARSNSAPNA